MYLCTAQPAPERCNVNKSTQEKALGKDLDHL